jgi:hypothetical protein
MPISGVAAQLSKRLSERMPGSRTKRMPLRSLHHSPFVGQRYPSSARGQAMAIGRALTDDQSFC